MICYLRGTVTDKSPTLAVVEAGGLGYEVLIPLSTFDRLPRVGEMVKLLTYHSVREDDEQLFGFITAEERDLFVQLMSVSGVGPKLALAILSGGAIGELSLAIASGNSKRLSSIKGVGKKTAEKICVELKDKVNAVAALSAAHSGDGGDKVSPVLHDAVLALSALGFSDEAANQMVSRVLASSPDTVGVETLVRKALAASR